MELLILSALWTVFNSAVVCSGGTLPGPWMRRTQDLLLQWNAQNHISRATPDLQLPDIPELIRRNVTVNLIGDNPKGIWTGCWTSISLHPFHLPCEFPQLFITIVYIPPKANHATTSIIFDVVQNLQSMLHLKHHILYWEASILCP